MYREIFNKLTLIVFLYHLCLTETFNWDNALNTSKNLYMQIETEYFVNLFLFQIAKDF